MKKIILRSSYFLYLLCFNILVSSLLFWLGELVLGNLKIGVDAYFGIGYLVLALLNIFLCKSENREKALDNFDNSWSGSKNIIILIVDSRSIFRCWRR